MYFIMINFGNSDDFLSVNRMLYKRTKQGMLNHYMLLLDLTQKNDKRRIKQLITYIRVKWSFFLVYIII